MKNSIFPNEPTLFKLCEENDDKKNGIIKWIIYGKKKNITKISCSIGEFQMLHYNPILNNYAYLRMLMCLLGKHECNELLLQYRTWLCWITEAIIWHKNSFRSIWLQTSYSI